MTEGIGSKEEDMRMKVTCPESVDLEKWKLC